MRSRPIRHAIVLSLLLAGLAGPTCAVRAQTGAPIGIVERLQGEAGIGRGSAVIKAATGTAIHSRDRLTTGAESRLLVKFNDDTRLTLGENAELLVAEHVYDPARGKGVALMELAQGAFRYVTGQMSRMSDRRIEVKTPLANLAVRGTDFWGGPSSDTSGRPVFGVLVLDGRVEVRNRGGRVTLAGQGQGTACRSATAKPNAPSAWARERIDRAVATVSFK